MTATQPPPGANILIVDDTPANVLLLVRMLTERGYKVRSVPSGKQALESARVDPPELILLDITMPVMNGYEVCEHLKNDVVLKNIPVIFISALSETLDKVKAFGVGGVDYVTKPFHFDEVYARIQTHLQLHRLEKLRLDLTHMVIHDLRNPLTAICYFLDLLEMTENQNLSVSTRELIPGVRRCAEELRNMISSILDVSKMEAGEMTLQSELCDLDVLIREVVDSSQPLPDDRSVTFESVGSVLTVVVDSGLIRRVFQNLLSNALKFTPKGGVVRIVAHTTLTEIRVTITDTGCGIPPEYHQQIFEKFGQVEAGNNRQGTGLGLTFCKMAVEAHHGRIGVESEAGKGSTFWITLPCPVSDGFRVPTQTEVPA